MLKVLFPWKQNNTKKVLFAMEQVVNEAAPPTEELPPEELPLLPCHVCNRTFLPNPLKKHIPICEQALRRKRKPFDSLKQRVEGTDMAPFYQKSYLKKSNPEMSSQAQAGDVYGNNKVSKWREKHFELQNTIKNAKGSTKSDMITHPPSSTSVTPNRKTGHLTVAQTSSNERCPVCDRSFGPKAFDRHVEFCKEQKNRVQVHKSPAIVQQAKERLEARINYRVPPLRQSKRSLIRDKYCPSSQTNLMHRNNITVPGKSSTTLSTSVTNMGPTRRQTINNERSVERNNNRKEAASKTRLDRTIGDCGDSKETTKNENGNIKSFHTKRTTPAKKINKTEVNDGLQGITVSSLSVEKDKKLVTWKDTVKIQEKVAPPISLTTTSTNVRRKVIPSTNEAESGTKRNLERVPSLGKVMRSRLLIEKLNMFVSKKKSKEIDIIPSELFENVEEISAKNKFSAKEEISPTERDLMNGTEVLENISNEEALGFSELALISEEVEVEDDSPKDSPVDDNIVCKKRVSLAVDCYEDEGSINVTQDIEKRVPTDEITPRSKANKKDNFSDEYNISTSEESSEQEYGAKNAFMNGRKDDSGDETKTEDTSSLCLRLPLEGMESKVKLKNNDLDPDQKLKKNIKSFYEIMKAGRCNLANKREQLSLLESSKDIKFLGAAVDRNEEALSPTSSGSNLVEKYEVHDESEEVIGEITKDGPDNESDITKGEPLVGIENIETSSIAFDTNEKVSFRISSRQSRSWKRRKKPQSCRMCIKCFIRKLRFRRTISRKNRRMNNEDIDGLDLLELGSLDNESTFGSLQILQEESFENNLKTSEDLLSRKNKSANCLKVEKSERFTRDIHSKGEIFRSLPDIPLYGKFEETKSNNYKLSAENSFDNVVPRKRRKISASYLNSGDDEYEVEKNLRQNISKIRRKKKEAPPLILDYEKIELGSSKTSAADVLYVNEVFASSLTPDRSELDSVNEKEDDGIQEYGDEELEGWEAAEEELMKELERKKLLTRCASPTKLTRPRSYSFVNEVTDNETRSLNIEIDDVESSKTLKNSSACTIVNLACKDTSSEWSDMFSSLNNPQHVSRREAEVEKSEETASSVTKPLIDKIPCRLPRIIPQNKHATPLRTMNRSNGENFKLPALGNLVLVRDMSVEVDMFGDKLTQVPSTDAKSLVSFCQQTSGMLVDESSSFSRGDFVENAEKESSSTTSTTPTTPTQYDPFEKAHLQLMELIEDDHNSYASSPISTLSTLSTPTIEFRPFVTVSSTPNATRKTVEVRSGAKRASVIDPPYGFQDARASRDLDQEFELLESLMNNNLNETSKDRTSYRRRGDLGEDLDLIDPSLINEQDNLSIPERMPSEEQSPIYEIAERDSHNIDMRESRNLEGRESLSISRQNSNNLGERGLSRNSCDKDPRDSVEHDSRDSVEQVSRALSEPVTRNLGEKVSRNLGEQVSLNLGQHAFAESERDSRNLGDRLERDSRNLGESLVQGSRPDRRPTRLSIKPTVRSLPLIRPDQVRLAPDGSSAESQYVEGRRGSPGSFVAKVKTRSKMRIDFSPETQKNKSNRRLGTSSLSRHAGLEIKKALDEHMQDISPKEETLNITRTPTAEELYPDNPIMYEEFRKYEEMYRREKEERRSGSSKKQKKTADFGINIDNSCKTYGDSAYGSLNRQQQTKELEISDQLKEFGVIPQSAATTPGERLSKFCHECGNKYPVSSAKFCVECGVKRLVL